MRNMSFMLTTAQVRAGTKTVTRRHRWWKLKAGDRIMACVKCQGLGKGGKIEHIREIEIVSTRREPLYEICLRPIRGGKDECAREGFPGMSAIDFVKMFCEHMGVSSKTRINRIEFQYV
jgi:hypothetical protein